jgi:hypothetical protein
LGDGLLDTIIPVDEDTICVYRLHVFWYRELIFEATRCTDNPTDALIPF